MNIKLLLVSSVGERNLTAMCSRFGVSRQAVYRWKKRYDELGLVGLEERSRAPKCPHGRTPEEVEDAVVLARKQLADEGWDCGPASVRDRLLGQGLAAPSEATIWRILTRRGLITPEPRKGRRAASCRFERARPNECWQVDDTHYVLAGGQEVRVVNLIDDHSRLNVDSLAVAICRTERAWECFSRAVERHGVPMEVLNDNGRAYISAAGERPCLFQRRLTGLGVHQIRSRPYHPQTCGKVERFHQTQRRWLDAHPTAGNLADLQALLDEFRASYNERRPHRALGRRTPASVWAAQPPAGPAPPLPWVRPPRTWTTLVNARGSLDATYDLTVGLGRQHAGKLVTLILQGNDAVAIDTHTGEILRELTIDPTRRYQPRTPRTQHDPTPKV